VPQPWLAPFSNYDPTTDTQFILTFLYLNNLYPLISSMPFYRRRTDKLHQTLKDLYIWDAQSLCIESRTADQPWPPIASKKGDVVLQVYRMKDAPLVASTPDGNANDENLEYEAPVPMLINASETWAQLKVLLFAETIASISVLIISI
jgi:hypothetical protein